MSIVHSKIVYYLCAMRYFIEHSYKGTAYHGWQKQLNGISVQEILEKALEQIETKGYLTPYLHQGKTCIGIGVNFSREEKKVKEFVWREFLG